jgi:site-specific DNA recombinase
VWCSEQRRLLRAIDEHQGANENYLDDGVNLLELARKAHVLFRKQEPREKRRLLNRIGPIREVAPRAGLEPAT